MRNVVLLLLMSMPAAPLWAQQERTVELKEVKVEAARVVERADGRLYLPSARQKDASTNGYSLLAKVALPVVRIDEVMHTIVALDNRGAVQVRINGVVADKSDLLALNPKEVKSVHFVDNPGVRYGPDIACVIDIRTQRDGEGVLLRVDLNNCVTAPHGDNSLYFKWNKGHSELGLAYSSSYVDLRGGRYREAADYLLADGTHHLIARKDVGSRTRNFDNSLDLVYNLADSATYVLQAKLSGAFSHAPRNTVDRLFAESGQADKMVRMMNKDRSFTPVLDLYLFRRLGSKRSVTANVVATAISTDAARAHNEGGAYAYDVDGNTWSLTSEAIYERQLTAAKLSFGVNHQLKYTRNVYSGSVASANGMHRSLLYGFGELKGRWRKWSYVAGLGVSNVRYRQDDTHYSFWLFRPKASLNYALTDGLTAGYTFEISQHTSQIAMVSDTRIRTNSMEWTVGNPRIKPNAVQTHAIRLAYNTPRFHSSVDMEYWRHSSCNMASYERGADNQFYYTQKMQPRIAMFYVSNYIMVDLIPERLSLSVNGGVYRFINRGDNYRHYLTACNYGGSLQAYLGRWTLTANADNGWKFMEGETWNRQGHAVYLTCSWRVGNCRVSLYWQHPFEKNPKESHAELVNSLIHKQMTTRSRDLGNMLHLGFTWKFGKGRRYRDIERRLQNKDTQTGIL